MVVVSMQRAFLEPEVGLCPFEWGKSGGKSIKHLGNRIEELGVEGSILERVLRRLVREFSSY